MKTVLLIAGSAALLLLTGFTQPGGTTRDSITLGKWSQQHINNLLQSAAAIEDPGRRIDFLSSQFLGARYKRSTLIGSLKTPEVFVINLAELDCFTLLDYVEAMRLSRSFAEFKELVKRIRYRSGRVTFQNRNHFFTDWLTYNAAFVEEATKKVGSPKTKTIRKIINQKENGTYYLPGIPCSERVLCYIPSMSIDESVMLQLKTGDYVGIYSDRSGLDVSHVGIVIKKSEKIYLRHASSVEKYRKVIDQSFSDVISGTPGIIILRPKVARPPQS